MWTVTRDNEKERTCTFWWELLGILHAANWNFAGYLFGEWYSWRPSCTNNLMHQIHVLQVPSLKAAVVPLPLIIPPPSCCNQLVSGRKLPYSEGQHAMPAIIQKLFFYEWDQQSQGAGVRWGSWSVGRGWKKGSEKIRSSSHSLLLRWQVLQGNVLSPGCLKKCPGSQRQPSVFFTTVQSQDLSNTLMDIWIHSISHMLLFLGGVRCTSNAERIF